jgi:Ca2+-binding RTX toxin-like protein
LNGVLRGTGNGLDNKITVDIGDNANAISGLAGNDTLEGDDGNDTLNGGTGADLGAARATISISRQFRRQGGGNRQRRPRPD